MAVLALAASATAIPHMGFAQAAAPQATAPAVPPEAPAAPLQFSFDLLAEDFAQVKGQDRHFDRSWRQLQQKLRKPQEAQGREIAQQLFLLGAGSQMLRHASPPVAQAWCRMMLDTRGGTLMNEQVQSDLLLRATGRVG